MSPVFWPELWIRNTVISLDRLHLFLRNKESPSASVEQTLRANAPAPPPLAASDRDRDMLSHATEQNRYAAQREGTRAFMLNRASQAMFLRAGVRRHGCMGREGSRSLTPFKYIYNSRSICAPRDRPPTQPRIAWDLYLHKITSSRREVLVGVDVRCFLIKRKLQSVPKPNWNIMRPVLQEIPSNVSGPGNSTTVGVFTANGGRVPAPRCDDLLGRLTRRLRPYSDITFRRIRKLMQLR
ncbi:unnamed protein product [Leptosia nina]|uniref:Uncharacterized protein n=1 Tax=Leptosia nina TaxID=320188 RepID=A0AAV1J0L4_9NEOP